MSDDILPVPRDFILPVAPGLAGNPIKRDWYSAHVRIGETLGDRVRDGVSRYLWSDDPGTAVSGVAIRIRALTEDVAARLSAVGLPERDLDLETSTIFALCASRKMNTSDTAAVPAGDEEMIHRYAGRAGLENVRVPAEMPRIRSYRMSRAGKVFTVTAMHAVFEADIARREDLVAAMRTGMGRDKGFGFGILTPVEEMIG